MNPISDWLAGSRHYDAGVALYLEHGNNALLKMMFQEGWSPFKEKKLSQVLEALHVDDHGHCCDACAHGHTCESERPTIHEPIKLTVDISPYFSKPHAEELVPAPVLRGWPAVMDLQVRELHDEWLPLFSEKKNLQSRIYEIAKAGETLPDKKTEAGTMAHRILDLRDQCRDIYRRRDHYLQHGSLPQPAAPLELPSNPALYHKSLSNYERYVREYKAKLAAEPQHPTAQAQIDKYSWGITELKKRLGINDAV